jgi:hypothetical protein
VIAERTIRVKLRLMSDLAPTLSCAQCGRPVPQDPDALRSWENGDLLIAGGLGDVTAAMLLCPECVEEDAAEAYDAGEPG